MHTLSYHRREAQRTVWVPAEASVGGIEHASDRSDRPVRVVKAPQGFTLRSGNAPAALPAARTAIPGVQTADDALAAIRALVGRSGGKA